jgi:hypothetical protein
MLGSFNHDVQGLQPRKSSPVPLTVDNCYTNGGYGAGTGIEVLLQKCCYSRGMVHLQFCAVASAPILLFTLGLQAVSLKVTITGNAQAINSN